VIQRALFPGVGKQKSRPLLVPAPVPAHVVARAAVRAAVTARIVNVPVPVRTRIIHKTHWSIASR